MTIWISRELPLFNFKLLDILCIWIGLPFEKLWPFELLDSFRCSISSVSIYYAPESDFRVTSYDNLNFSRASTDQFQASRYIMRLNRTSVWKDMTIWISRELPWFNFKLLDTLSTWIRLPCEKLWPFKFLKSFRCSISSVSVYYPPESDFRVISYDHLNSRELPLFNFERLGILCAWIGLRCDKLWPFEFLESFRCSISSFSICYASESDFRLKSYDHLNCSIAFVVQFRASRYIMRLNRTSV